ncbi:MAG: hypothetical protein DRI57_08340 [Deltaproteobacteria bacterium]|nr:MAG: hypothetical protein DRI57_08340 [Deltaproteobacteria bacterium]
MTSQNTHLSEEQIICAVVDEQDLPAAVQHHLSACPMCQDKKQQFDRALNTLEEMTEAFSPLPQRKIRLPDHQPFFGKITWFPVRIPAFAAGLALFLLTLSIWYPGNLEVSKEKMRAQVLREAELSPPLMKEINALEEYTLPDLCQEISGESYGYFTNEFMDFVVPPEESRIDAVRSDHSRA